MDLHVLNSGHFAIAGCAGLLRVDPNVLAAGAPIQSATRRSWRGQVQKQVVVKPEQVQISTAYGQQQERSKIATPSMDVEIKSVKPETPEKAKCLEFKTCKFTTEAIASEGIDKGELRKVCTQADCPIHYPTKQPAKTNARFKAEQDKNRRDEALANATGIRGTNHRSRRSSPSYETRFALHRETDIAVA